MPSGINVIHATVVHDAVDAIRAIDDAFCAVLFLVLVAPTLGSADPLTRLFRFLTTLNITMAKSSLGYSRRA